MQGFAVFPRFRFLPGALACRRRIRAVWLGVLLAASPLSLTAQNELAGIVFQTRETGFVPVAGARVEVQPAGGGGVLHEVETGSMGRYFLSGLGAGEFVVTVSHPRYYMAEESEGRGRTVQCPTSSGVCTGGDFEMLPAGELAVSVVDSLGLPVEQASIQVRRLGGPERTLSPDLRTVGGVFRVPGMAPGRYRVEAGPVERRGIVYRLSALELDFPRGVENRSVRLVMNSEREYRVAGRILGLDPMDDRLMMVLLEPDGENAVASRLGAPVDPSGHFAVNGVPGGSYSLRLVWARDSGLDLANGPGRLLGKVTVADDVKDLLFSQPAVGSSR